MYHVILKSLKSPSQFIILSEEVNAVNAGQMRRQWRNALGKANWHQDRRPGLDTLDHLAITVIQTQEPPAVTDDELILKTNELMRNLEENIKFYSDGLISASELARKNASEAFSFSTLVANTTLAQKD